MVLLGVSGEGGKDGGDLVEAEEEDRDSYHWIEDEFDHVAGGSSGDIRGKDELLVHVADCDFVGGGAEGNLCQGKQGCCSEELHSGGRDGDD